MFKIINQLVLLGLPLSASRMRTQVTSSLWSLPPVSAFSSAPPSLWQHFVTGWVTPFLALTDLAQLAASTVTGWETTP